MLAMSKLEQAVGVPDEATILETGEPGPEVAESGPAIVGDPFFDLQLTFNLFPALYAHPSWLVYKGDLRLAEGWRAVPPSSAFWVRRFSDALLRKRALEKKFDFDFVDHAKRLALIDSRTLLMVGKWVATVLVRDRLRRIVRGGEVEAMQKAVSVDAHRFALRWNGRVPTLPSKIHRVSDQWPTNEAWMLRGAVLLSSALPKSSSIFGRLQFKFPRRWSHAKLRLHLSEQERSSLAGLFVDIIMAEFSEWAWLFGSESPGPEAVC